MSFLSPTRHERLNEVAGLLLLSTGLVAWLSMISYHADDPSWNSATGASRPLNLIGYAGSYGADWLLQGFGISAFLLPLFIVMLGWKWVRSEAIISGLARCLGGALLIASLTAVLSLAPPWNLYGGAIPANGLLGAWVADFLVGALNELGALLCAALGLLLSVYLLSTFQVSRLNALTPAAQWIAAAGARLWKSALKTAASMRPKKRLKIKPAESKPSPVTFPDPIPAPSRRSAPAEDIPIRTLDEEAPVPAPQPRSKHFQPELSPIFRLPSTELLHEPPARGTFNEEELKATAARVKSKFQEFNVLGSVVQINPGPVVTTFEFKPEAGIKYSRITTLTEDLCLGLQAESILIERIPGKPTVGIEVPNSTREVISLRQILESEEFLNSPSRLTISLGKDINGRIRVAALDTMPHLLIAGSTGSGKSVMINSMIMSILYKSTPEEVRMIMIDPKRLELGLYEGIPHLMTPVIIDPKKATNALRNAVLEMERRLRLLASQGVRSIDQFNKKIQTLREQPGDLFEDNELPPEELKPLPYILILIDELADLMMLEGHNVEESVTRLAQMARAVGMHLVLATQRPSVDVITGLIKANFPARISFRVATRVDSRTILDVMGSEHLLGKGDMLFLPPGSSRLIRVHGAFVTETEIARAVNFWKEQAAPEYDQSYLAPPPAEGEEEEQEEPEGEEDPMYQEAMRIVLEMGKASTSTLQRRLRLGYGRAARILDMMQRDGIIGPPDGSKPREVLKRPDWLNEVKV